MIPPKPVSAAAQATFETQARTMGLDPNHPWVGGYVDYEWTHLRPLVTAYAIETKDRHVLEFGCNVGASAVVFAELGANVRAVDIQLELIALARSNAARYGHHEIEFLHVPDTRHLPFDDASFDLVSCNSVLEYVAHDRLAEVQRELDRVLKPGGLLLITGTSSRLWPREVHTGFWFVNYLPRWIDRLLPGGRSLTRGVAPWTIRYGFGLRYENLDARNGGIAFLQARANMDPPEDRLPHRVICQLAKPFGIGPGLLMNNISCLLKKPQVRACHQISQM